MITEDKIWINNNWINVDGVGRIGMYSKYYNAILLDYSMKWIVGTNERIECSFNEIKGKVLQLFNCNQNIKKK